MTGITLIRYKFFRWDQDYYPIIYNKKWWLYSYFLSTSYHKYKTKSMVIMKSQEWILILVKSQVIPCNHLKYSDLPNKRAKHLILFSKVFPPPRFSHTQIEKSPIARFFTKVNRRKKMSQLHVFRTSTLIREARVSE